MTGSPDLPMDKREAERLNEIEARLAALEGARQMQATTMKGGTFLLSTPTDAPVFVFGHFTNKDGQEVYGVTALDTITDDGDQSTILSWDSASRGMIYPFEYHQWVVPTAQAISSGTFVNIAEAEVHWTNGDCLFALGAVIAPVGSTAEIRIRDGTYGNLANVVTVGSGLSVLVKYEWLHPFSVGWGDLSHPQNSPLLQWQARLASGAGPISVFPPRHLTFKNRRFATAPSTLGGGRIA